MRSISLTLALMATYVSAFAQPVTDLMPMLEQARTTGEARGTLGGEAAQRLAEAGFPQPVEVIVTRLATLREPGCARLMVRLVQRGVTIPGETSPRDRETGFEANLCEGGRSPSSEEGARPVTVAARPKAASQPARPKAATGQSSEPRR
jgi:hypothetical protein